MLHCQSLLLTYSTFTVSPLLSSPRTLLLVSFYLCRNACALQKETAECTFSPQRMSADRGARYLQNPCKDPAPPSDYRPYLQEKRRREEGN